MRILIDTSPLDTGHALRGIGTYTRLLAEHLETQPNNEVRRSGTEEAKAFDPDIVHYPYFDFFFSTLPLFTSKPVVVTVHDVIPLKFPRYYPVGVKGKATFIKQKAALKRAQAVITDSEASKEDIRKHLKIKKDKIHVVYLAANPDLKAASEVAIAQTRKKYSLPKHYVLYVGDINYNKNIPQLIKAIRYLPPTVKLVAVGKAFHEQPIPEWQWIDTQLALSDVRDKVQFITDVPGSATEDLSALYSGALCYVQPSLYEGFGLPVLEAMQCRTPVVATETSSLTEVGGDHVVYTQTDAESIATGIQEAISWSESKRAEVVRKAYAWSQTFSWKKTAQQTLEVYKKVLKLS